LDALDCVTRELTATKADLVLGVFPANNPHELGPVRVASDGVVECVFDKPARTAHMNTWGIAAWTPTFFDLLMRETATGSGEVVLGAVFNRACEEGLRVRAVQFRDGLYRDLGTPGGLTQLFREYREPPHGDVRPVAD
jgi:glucose-1-phosphate thymidylyltransferase